MGSRVSVLLAIVALGVLAAAVVVIDGGGAGASGGSEAVSDWDVEQRRTLAGVDFPVYSPEGLTVELGGWGGGDGQPVSSVRLVHESRSGEGPTLVVDSDYDGDSPQDDYAERAVEDFDDADVDVVSGERPLRVDGVVRQFAFASVKDEWVAIARLGDVTVKVHGSGIDADEVHLRTLADPSQGLAGAPAYGPLRPALEVLDRRRVQELAEGTRLAGVSAPLAAAARPALALLPSREDTPSWFGGTPHLPADVRWPEGEYGPMLFVAQISLADLDPAVWASPATGQLHVFCDADDESGAIEGPDACTVVHSSAGATLRERPYPADLDEDKQLPRFPVKPHSGLSLPEAATPLLRRLGIELEDSSEYDELWTLQRRLESEQGWHNPHGQLLGWDRVPGEDLMAMFASEAGGRAEDWTLLLHTDVLDADLYVAVRNEDLNVGRFDDVQAGLFFD